MDEFDKIVKELLEELLTPEMIEAEVRRRLVARREAHNKMIARKIIKAAVKAKEKEEDEKLIAMLKSMGIETL